MKPEFKSAFSLMELMIVLLIVAIIAAASAPMITKKMMRNSGTNDSPWVFTGLAGNSIAYNLVGSNNSSAIIGSTEISGLGTQHPRLIIDTPMQNFDIPAIVFSNGGQYKARFAIGDDDNTIQIGSANGSIDAGILAIGLDQILRDTSHNSVVIGNNAQNTGHANVIIGDSAVAVGTGDPKDGSIAIGSCAEATGIKAIAIGSPDTQTNGARALSKYAIAIGSGAEAEGENSVAIGSRVKASADNQIVIGGNDSTVFIPGNLVVGKKTYLGINNSGQNSLWLRCINGYGDIHDTSDHGLKYDNHSEHGLGDKYTESNVTNSENSGSSSPGGGRTFDQGTQGRTFGSSDRRLKNVGEKYTAGLEQLKKLDFFHYTFKKDEAKKPQVGVIAQDLQKVFPDSVWAGEDGYLRIRWDEMFYAVINAVKELDTKVAELANQVKSYFDKTQQLEQTVNSQQETIKAQQKAIEAQQKAIDVQQKTIKELTKRLEKLEK